MKSTAHNGTVIASVEGADVIECAACGFKHVSPLPSAEELKEFYEQDFYQTEKKNYFKEIEEDRDWWALTYDRRLDLLARHAKGRKLLDIGSGPGLFLESAKRRGWQAIGFEPSPEAADYARGRGCEVVTDFFTAEKARAHGPFDAITLNLVLEHVPDPAKIIREAREALAPGGALLIVSPNDFNPIQEVLWKHEGYAPWWVVPKHHLNYFSTASIQALLKKCGIDTLALEATYPMEFFLLSGRNYVGNASLGRACHGERKAFETALYRHAPELLAGLYRRWAEQGIGREFVIAGQISA